MTSELPITPIASALAAAFLLAAPDARALQTVTTCADSGTGSLRAAIANAGNGDTVTFNAGAMNCSTITLTTGALVVHQADLTLTGPDGDLLIIDANLAGRVIDHEGAGTLHIAKLAAIRGFISASFAYGGCIYSKGSVAAANVTVYGCRAQTTEFFAAGGGIYAHNLDLRDSTISHSVAAREPGGASGGGWGGGAYVIGTAAVRSSTFYSNLSDFGGGLMATMATIDGATFTDNSASFGAAIAVGGQAGQLQLMNSTISANTAYVCAGIFSSSPNAPSQHSITLSNSTVAFNKAVQATYGGHPYAAGLCGAGTLSVQSSIIANNRTDYNTATPHAGDFSAAAGTSLSGAGNLIMATLAGTTAPAGTLTADPKLQPLADNGGPTRTHALGPGSPAIASGNNAARLASDQRGPGYARMTGRKTDIGAFQSGDGIFACGAD